MTAPIEFALDTFGDVTSGPDGAPLPHAQVIRNLVEEAVLADGLGIDFFGIGEHHRDDFAVSAPEVLLGAIAARTERIRLGTAVTVLSSDDPIRVFQRFSTLDALSNGRAEVVLGRGSFTESFPLFGFDMNAYETLFEEKLDLFAELLKGGPARWQGSIRPALDVPGIFPPIENGTLKTWVGVGGSPQSVVRAAHYGLPLMLAIIGGDPARFRPYVDLYHQALERFGKSPQLVGVHSHGYVAETEAAAKEELWPHWKAGRDRIGKDRGWPPAQRADFEREIEGGSLYLGTPEMVARRIASTVKVLGLARFEMKYSAGTLPHERMMRSIELYGTKVVPMVKDMLA